MRKWLLGFTFVLVIGNVSSQELIGPFIQGDISSEAQLPIFQEDEEPVPVLATPYPTFGFLVELVFLLFILAGLSYLVVLLLKRAQKTRLGSEGKTIDSFRVLSEQLFSKNKTLKIIELYSQIIVLSESPAGLQFLYEVKDEDVKNRILLDFSREEALKKAKEKEITFFSKWQDQFSKLTGSFAPKLLSKGRGEENEKQDGKEFLETSCERLKRL